MKPPRNSGRIDWPAVAGGLARRLPLDRLHHGALDAIRSAPEDDPIAIACSGGADSVALLLLLWAHLPERRGRWFVLHFDHRLRGPASAADARFVQKLAAALGERCEVGVWSHEKRRPGNISEAVAREARWAFFDEQMRVAGASVIALGHQRDDIAETMLMRLTRGSGSGGLAAPRPVQKVGGSLRVRPLLDLTSRELRAALRTVGATWREDASNAGDAYFRNRIRSKVLPALAAASPVDVGEGFARSREQLDDDDTALEAWLAELLPDAPKTGTPFDLLALAGRPRALVRRAVHRWLLAEGQGGVLARPAVEAIVEAVFEGRDLRTSAGQAGFAVLRAGALSIERADAADAAAKMVLPAGILARGEPWLGPRGDRLALKVRRLTPTLFREITSGRFSCAATAFLGIDPGDPLTVRGWVPGDRFRPLGAPGRSKLQDLFVNRKIPRDQRAVIPVICRFDGAIVWVPGWPPARESAVQSGAKEVVQLTYTPPGNIVPASLSKTPAHVRLRKA